MPRDRSTMLRSNWLRTPVLTPSTRARPVRLALWLVSLTFAAATLAQTSRPATLTPTTAPTTAPTTRPTTGRALSAEYKLVEWAVFVADPNQPLLNEATLYQSTLPEFAADKRPSAPGSIASTQPSPVGVIRLFGSRPSDGGKIDVLLQLKKGRFLSHWPQSKGRPDRLLWDELDLVDQPQRQSPVSAESWYGHLREAPSAHLLRQSNGEQFLLYDVELESANPLRVNGGKDYRYGLVNAGQAPLHDVQVYKPTDGGWRTGGVAELAPAGNQPAAAAGTAGTTAPSGQTKAGAKGKAGNGKATKGDAANGKEGKAKQAPAKGKKKAGGKKTESATTLPAVAPQPATNPSTGPTGTAAGSPAAQPRTPAGTPLLLNDRATSNASEALGFWKSRLTELGIATEDIPTILTILEVQALRDPRLTVVYRLDEGQMDRLLPLEVTPSPQKTVRVGLVIVRNLDPAIADDVEHLIAELGNDDWAKREAAQKQLAEIGQTAKPKLEAALKNPDLEIVWRCEQLIERLTPKKEEPSE